MEDDLYAKRGEEQVSGETLAEATLMACELLKRRLRAIDHRWRQRPIPTPYEDVATEKGETVQLIVTPSDSPEETEKRGNGCFPFGILLCLVAVFFYWVLMEASPGGCATSSAEAANIVTDLRNLKAAAIMYYAEHLDTFSSLPEKKNHLDPLLNYVDNPEKERWNSCAFHVVDNVGWVGYDLAKRSRELFGKLEGKAQSIGLFGSPSIDEPPASVDVGHLYKRNDGAVWIVGVNLAYEYESRNRQ
jgi:hypothetical protein